MMLRLYKRCIKIEWKRLSKIAWAPFHLWYLSKTRLHGYTLIATYICASTKSLESISLSYKEFWWFFCLLYLRFLVFLNRGIKVISGLWVLVLLDIYNAFTSICVHLIFLRNLRLINCCDLSCLAWVFFCSKIL
jgi:FtsH-binding integral membrane protein